MLIVEGAQPKSPTAVKSTGARAKCFTKAIWRPVYVIEASNRQHEAPRLVLARIFGRSYLGNLLIVGQ